MCLVCLHPVFPLSACGHILARRVARACRYAATRILTDARAPAPSLSCDPQGTLFAQQRAHRPPRDGVQRAHEPSVRREGRETHHRHTHTHTQARAQALSACRWGHIPARRVARACRYAATRILTDPRAPAPSLSCVPQVPLFVQQQAPSPPRDGVQRAHEPCVRREGRETHHRHTHTHKHGRQLSLHAAGGTCPRVVWHAHAAMLPSASSLTRVRPRPLSRVCSAGASFWTTTSSQPSPRRCSTGSRTFSKEGGERDTSQTHTHTRKHGRKLSLHAAGGTYPRVVWHAHAAMLPSASSDPRAPTPSLSCVPQGPRFGLQRAHRPPRDGVQRANEP